MEGNYGGAGLSEFLCTRHSVWVASPVASHTSTAGTICNKAPAG